MKSFAMIFTANLKEFVRDRSGLFWTFAFPVCFIFLFGALFSTGNMGFSFDYILPGILGLALMQLGLFGALQFLNLREKKILRGLSLTPLSRSTLLSSEIVLRLLAGFVQTGIILTIAFLIFGIKPQGSILQLLPIITIGALSFISLGYLLICFVNSLDGGTGLAQIVQLPMMFLSGIFVPIEMMPEFLQPLVRLIPLTYLADALREVMVGIPGSYSLPVNLGVLFAFLSITFLLGIKFWRWE